MTSVRIGDVTWWMGPAGWWRWDRDAVGHPVPRRATPEEAQACEAAL